MTRAALTLLVSLLLVVGLSGSVFARALESFHLGWWHISGGGGRATSTNWALEGNLGLPVAGVVGSAEYALASGFWYGLGMPGPVVPTPTLYLPFRAYLPALLRQ